MHSQTEALQNALLQAYVSQLQQGQVPNSNFLSMEVGLFAAL